MDKYETIRNAYETLQKVRKPALETDYEWTGAVKASSPVPDSDTSRH